MDRRTIHVATPAESLRHWNWGAFFLTWIWAAGNKSFDRITLILVLLCFAGRLGFFAAIILMGYSGWTGNDRALRNKEWRDYQHFAEVQRRWAIAGIGQFCLAVLVLLALGMTLER